MKETKDDPTPRVAAGARVDRQEVARFLRPQPPYEVPRRHWVAPAPGLVAGHALGYRVIRRLQGQS